MARIFSTGGEELDPNVVWDTLTTSLEASLGYQVNFLTNYVPAVVPRTGYACWRLAGSGGTIRRTFAANPTEIYMGFAYYTDVNERTDRPILLLSDTGIQLYHYTGDTLRVTRGGTQLAISSAGMLSKSVWHYIEVHLKPLNTGGVCQVKLDGFLICDFSGDTTDNNQYLSGIVFQAKDIHSNGYVSVLLDDIVVNDTAGSANNSWPGQVRLLPIHPAAAGDSSQWSRTGVNLGNNIGQTRHSARGIFAVLQTDTAENTDLYIADVPDLPADATITNVIVAAVARKPSGAGGIALLCKGGSTTQEGANQALAAGYKLYSEAFPVNPADSAAWEESDLTGMQIGIRAK